MTDQLVGDVRGIGLFAGVELMKDAKARMLWAPEQKVGTIVQDHTLCHGLIVRVVGNRIAFTPPLIITEEQIGEMCQRFKLALDDARADLKL